MENYVPATRNKRSLWSGFWSSVTGTSTAEIAETSDVNKLRSRLRNIEAGVHNAAQAWRTGSSHFVAAVEAEKRELIDVDVDVVDLRAQADASMPASNNNVKLYNISNF